MKILWKLLLAQIRERNETCSNTLPDMLYKQRPARQDNQDLTCDLISQFLNDGVSKFLLKTTIQY